MRALLALLAALSLALPSAVSDAQMWPFPGPGHASYSAPSGWTSIGSFLTAADGSSASTWAPVTSAQLDAGNVGVCVLGKDETGTGTTDGTGNAQFTSATDAAGNTWVEAIEWCNMQTSTAANGACTAVYYTLATTNLASGAAITFTFGAATTAKGISCWEYSIPGNTLAVAAGSNGVANDAADPGALTDDTTVSAEHLFVRASGCESSDATYTADTDYTTFTHTSSQQGSGATAFGVRGEFRIASESTSASSDPTYVAADCASAIVALDQTTSGGGDPNSSPGSQAADLSGATDRAVADTNAASTDGSLFCVYWRWGGSEGAPSGTNVYRAAMGVLDNATSELGIYATNAAGTWPTITSHLWSGGDSDCGASVTATTTTDWAACLLLAGDDVTQNARMWVWEHVSGSVWTERCDILDTATPNDQADVAYVLGNSEGNTYPLKAKIKYAFVRNNDFDVNPSAAASEDGVVALLNCSVDPAEASITHVWPFTTTSTSSEADLDGAGTAMDFQSSLNSRVTGEPLWSGFGLGTLNSDCTASVTPYRCCTGAGTGTCGKSTACDE